MQAVVLVGGQGTRLRPLTNTTPKPVLPLAGRPMISYLVEWLARHGVTQVVLSIGFLAGGLREALAEVSEPELVFAEEPEPRGTAGAIRFCEGMLDDRFLALNGDVLCDLDLTALVAQHERTGARATLALYPVEDPSAYGLVRHTPDGEVTEFVEKPDPSEIDTDEISAGAYVLERELLDLIPPEREVSIEREVFPRLVGDGLYARRLEGYWMDIGTPERFLRASDDILSGQVRTAIGDRLRREGTIVEDGGRVADGARLEPPVLVCAGAAVEAGARVSGPAVVGAGSSVGEGASLQGSILFDGCLVGAEARVGRAILGRGVQVARGAEVPDGSVVEDGASL